ncbi:MAG: class I SAM-dependent methyltransferase [Desulfomonilaceae bacterium]|nr:class I SAM-dependent methyltransferase [Desulfomonilaceae bacterium]
MLNETERNQVECDVPCNLCNSTAVDVLSVKDRKGNDLRTVICEKCGLIWSDPRPNEELIKEFYSTEYRREYKGIARPKKKHVYRDAKEAIRRYRFIEDLLAREDSLLDIGAGNGVFVYCLRKLGFNAEGIGPDENLSRYAREVLHVPVKTGFAADLRDEESYDIVTLHHVLEHMTDPSAELKNIRAMLKQHGKLVVEVPNAEDTWQDPKNRYHKAHVYTFNPETLIALGECAGFRALRKRIAPHNGNITAVFQKRGRCLHNSVDLNTNYAKITTILRRHTNYRHFLSVVPYKKILVSAVAAVAEQIAVRKFFTDTEIIDTVIDSEVKPEGTTANSGAYVEML